MTEEYKQKLHDILQSDMIDVIVFMETSKGFPSEMSIEQFESKTLLEQIVMCIEFRKKYPKIFRIKGNPYQELNKEYYGEQPQLTFEEFKLKYPQYATRSNKQKL